MSVYRYTQSWFLRSELRKSLLTFIDISKPQTVLEIGCYEGLSSVFFADNLLDISGSSLTCVDPFMRLLTNDHSALLINNEEENFDYNMKHCKHSDKITIHKITSDDFFKMNSGTYTFIYIDGCHECEFIKRDMENAFNVLQKGGIMWMDDYGGGDGIEIKRTMNAFLIKYKDLYEIIHMGYQLAIRKI